MLLKQGMESGEVAPLPWTVYGRAQCQDALRILARGASPRSLAPSSLRCSCLRSRARVWARKRHCHYLCPVPPVQDPYPTLPIQAASGATPRSLVVSVSRI